MEERLHTEGWLCEKCNIFPRQLTLIRIILSSMPTYFTPLLLRLRVKQIQRNFLWGGGDLDKHKAGVGSEALNAS